MKQAKSKKILSALASSAIVCAGGAAPTIAEATVDQATGVDVQVREQETYAAVANVDGDFRFQQDILTPPDEIFSLFGTAATAACAKPGFAFDEADLEDYYINVGGNIKKVYSVSYSALKERPAHVRNMVCSCATGSPVVNARVTGVKVADIISMADLEDGVNTITIKDAQGYGLPLPLSYVLEKDALLVYKINDVELPLSQGAPLQVWMPDTVAKYFTRQVTEISLTAQENVPTVEGPDSNYRAKVNVLNRFTKAFNVGDKISFEGYADDCGVAIKAVEFSLDNGETWTSYATKGANPQQWVYWSFDYTSQNPETYKLDVRARTEDDVISPLASSIVFTVEDTAV